jgi:competence transcription factor ComK
MFINLDGETINAEAIRSYEASENKTLVSFDNNEHKIFNVDINSFTALLSMDANWLIFILCNNQYISLNHIKSIKDIDLSTSIIEYTDGSFKKIDINSQQIKDSYVPTALSPTNIIEDATHRFTNDESIILAETAYAHSQSEHSPIITTVQMSEWDTGYQHSGATHAPVDANNYTLPLGDVVAGGIKTGGDITMTNGIAVVNSLDGKLVSLIGTENTVPIRDEYGNLEARLFKCNIGAWNMAASHYFFESSDPLEAGFIAKKPLADVRTEIVTKEAVEISLTGDINSHSHSSYLEANKAAIEAILTGLINSHSHTYESIPPGAVEFFAMSTPPSGWLKCNGALLSRTVYADLFAKIGTAFGAGNGYSTFSIPDLRGEFLRALDDGKGVDVGRVLGSTQADAIRDISGQLLGIGGQPQGNPSANGVFLETLQYNGGGAGGGGQLYNTSNFSFDASRVVPTASENRPRNIALLACIKY